MIVEVVRNFNDSGYEAEIEFSSDSYQVRPLVSVLERVQTIAEAGGGKVVTLHAGPYDEVRLNEKQADRA